jgi:pimeloyl-ACP methyl ester carboxylesterase
MMLFHPTTSEEVKDRVKTDFANSDPEIAYATLLHQMQYSFADAQRLEQLDYMLYLINSDAVPTNETGLQNHCKNGFEVETISATGHYPMNEKPGEFNSILEKVLAGLN